LFKRYGSMEEMLRTLYPTFRWKAINFAQFGGKASNGFWDDLRNQREMLDIIGEHLGVKQVLALECKRYKCLILSLFVSLLAIRLVFNFSKTGGQRWRQDVILSLCLARGGSASDIP